MEQLLANQQNPASRRFHKWLTPEQYAERFGVSQNDVNRITAWLQSQGLQVQRVARSRTWIEFSGTAQQVENALHTQIHQYLENGKLHYANSTDPSIPAAFSDVMLGLRGLNNYRLKPRGRVEGAGAERYHRRRRTTRWLPTTSRLFTMSRIFTPTGIDGNGQKLAVMGQTDINRFRY